MKFLSLSNGEPVSLDALPLLSMKEFCDFVLKEAKAGKRIVSFFGIPLAPHKARLIACLSNEKNKKCLLASAIAEKSYPSLTPALPQAHLFEREIFEETGIVPLHHPWLKNVRLHPKTNPSSFFQVKGMIIHEVAVGPVHAGIIEPGHFRFNCDGETVLHLEISLGYQHRGIAKALIGGPNCRTIHLMETLSGDTTAGHATAYSMILESLSGSDVPPRAQYVRAIALELERLANHTGDLGALANDIGFLPTASFCGRLRGDFLNLTADICGNRFGRNLVRPGGVDYDIADPEIFGQKLERAYTDTMQAADLLWRSTTILTRFENTGTLSPKLCHELGIVGLAARSSGLKRDVRADFPFGIYRTVPITVAVQTNGDVYARAYLRYLEIQKSSAYIQKLLGHLPAEPAKALSIGPLRPDSLTIALVEGWRGEICHIAITDGMGKFLRYQIVDPSFHNWMGLAMAMRQEQISNFPLCNKSFNLSYCGHDL